MRHSLLAVAVCSSMDNLYSQDRLFSASPLSTFALPGISLPKSHRMLVPAPGGFTERNKHNHLVLDHLVLLVAYTGM